MPAKTIDANQDFLIMTARVLNFLSVFAIALPAILKLLNHRGHKGAQRQGREILYAPSGPLWINGVSVFRRVLVLSCGSVLAYAPTRSVMPQRLSTGCNH